MFNLYKKNKIKLFFKNNPIIAKIYFEKYSDLVYDETTIPYISINHYRPKIYNDEDVIIPFYFTDFYQREYYYDDKSLKFRLRYELDGEIKYIDDMCSGDHEINLGKLQEGMHWYSLQVIDKDGRESRRIFNDLYIVDRNSYPITEEQTYNITDDDLLSYSINRNNSEVLEDMINNKVGLSQLFSDLQKQGYRKCVLPEGIYRINRSSNKGTIEEKNCPIIIPTMFTVDMNNSIFKLHPYTDSEYGDIAHVENLMVRMSNTFDSHVINGTFQGDFIERNENGWLSGGNGEHCNTFYSYGSEFCSLDNITIKNTTGYNVCVGQDGSYGTSRLGNLVDNLAIENGEEIIKNGYTTSDISLIGQDMLDNHYITASTMLGYGYLRGNYWEIDFHFYDENQQFLETIKSYQYTRCRIPKNAKYFRVTFIANASDVNGISIYHMINTRYFELNNCHWEDNRTCSAPFQFQHLAYNNCTFNNSMTQSITPCDIDLEDGWEQMQDFFMINCKCIRENNQTASIIDCSGLNHNYENCTNILFTLRYRIRGITLRNNTSPGNCSLVVGYMTGNTFRCYNNSFGDVTYRDTGDYFLKEKMKYKIKNCQLSTCGTSGIGCMVKDNCIINGLGGENHEIINSELYRTNESTDYIGGNIIQSNCSYNLKENQTLLKFSFNTKDVKRIYNNCVYNAPCLFANHYYFNCGIWNNCKFKENLEIAPGTQTLCMGQIQFNNCKFEKDVTIVTKKSQVQFNNCEFLGQKIFKENAESLTEFNDSIPEESKYIKINNHLDYMNINESYKLSTTILPYTSKIRVPKWETSDPSIVEVNEDGSLNMKTIGTCNIIAKNHENTESDTISINFVDVDYRVGQYLTDSGKYQNYLYACMDNRYVPVNKTNIKLSYSKTISLKYLHIGEFNENKEFIKTSSSYIDGNTNYFKYVTLSSETKYILIGFTFKYNGENRFPELFSTYTIS